MISTILPNRLLRGHLSSQQYSWVKLGYKSWVFVTKLFFLTVPTFPYNISSLRPKTYIISWLRVRHTFWHDFHFFEQESAHTFREKWTVTFSKLPHQSSLFTRIMRIYHTVITRKENRFRLVWLLFLREIISNAYHIFKGIIKPQHVIFKRMDYI